MLLVASGTGVLFSGLVFAFVIIACLAFNAAGGLSRTPGTYVFFFSTNAVLLGLCVKVTLWEPTELYMLSPLTTMAMYTGGILSMFVAVYLTRRFGRKEGFLQDVVSTKNMRLAAIGCVVGGILFPAMAQAISATSQNVVLITIARASNQLDRFLPLAVILGVTYEIRSSGGKRSANAWVWIAGIILVGQGCILNFSKEGLFTTPVCWLIAAAALRYRFRPVQMAGIVLFFAFALVYLVPYCQWGRLYRDEDATLSDKIQIAAMLLPQLNDIREKQRLHDEEVDRTESPFAYFSKPMGLFDRLTMMGVDDRLVTVTDQKGAYGLQPIVFYIASTAPKFIWKNKPFVIMGNLFAHEIGFNENDFTTGISFSPVVEGYHEAKWFGVFVVCPLCWFVCFLIIDSVCGDVRKSPWGILMSVLIAHLAPEGMLQGVFYIATYGTFAIAAVAFVSAYLMPLLAHFVSPPRRAARAVEARAPIVRPAFINARPARTEP